jgi:hypothetical protein
MMKWEGFGRKLSWPIFKVLSLHSLGGSEENHELRVDGMWAEI